MDNWGILAWIGERACTRMQCLAPPPSAFKVLFAKGTVLKRAENGTRNGCGSRKLTRAYRTD